MYVNKQALRDSVDLAAEVFSREERIEQARKLLEGTGWGVYERETVMQAADLLEKDTDALDAIAKVWNSSTTNQQDIVNAVGKALQATGYELRY